MNLWKKNKIFLAFLLSVSTNAYALNTVATGFQVAADELKTIVAHNVCKKVWNTGTSAHFVATKSFLEWSSFYTNTPANITIRDCYSSCSNLYKSGVTTDGLYSIDVDGAGPTAAMNIYCDQTNDGGGWTRVFKHNIADGYFADNTAAASSNTSDPNNNLYSILSLLDNFKSMNRLTFKLYWPNEALKNIWSQQSSPIYHSPVIGYRPIDINVFTNYWGGLEFSNITSSYLDGSAGHSNWYYSVGAKTSWSGGIPLASQNSSLGVNEVQLYVHDGGLKPMSCQHIIELGESRGSRVYTIYPDQVNGVDVYCDMDLDSGGWTLFYANASDASMSIKKSYTEHLADQSGIAITDSNYSNPNTVGMLDFKEFSPTQAYARDIGNWTSSQYSRIDFNNDYDFKMAFEVNQTPAAGINCRSLPGAGIFKFSNSNGTSYYYDKGENYNGIGWGDCMASVDQTDASDVENYPRHFLYNITAASDSTRVRGIGGFNNGDLNAKARYFLREKYDKPKNCMDILTTGQSVGDGTYTIYPDGVAVSVECDMNTHGGGWTKVWHGYPSRAAHNSTTGETYAKSNSISFNQVRMQGVNIGVDMVDQTYETAYLKKTIREYYYQQFAIDDTLKPTVKFADRDGVENVGMVGNFFFRGYGNFWRIFYPCVNANDTSDDYIYLAGYYSPGCPIADSFIKSDITTCTSTGNNYCTDAYTSTETDSGLGLTLRQYQETAVWVRSLPSMRSCREILDRGYSSGDGVYLIDPDGPNGTTFPFATYCDMTTNGGGWTLVWSNTRTGTNKPVTGLSYADSIATRPRCSNSSGSVLDTSGACSSLWTSSLTSLTAENAYIERFNYFVGLDHWNSVGAGGDMQLMYKWSADYERDTDMAAIMNIDKLDSGSNYTLKINSYSPLIGSVTAGIRSLGSFSSGVPWTTVDADNDANASNCASNYSNSPWWYTSCWSGSMNGGGEADGLGYFNGAYWTGSAKQWADPVTAAGAGNGWIFIREHKREGRYKSSCKEILEDDPSAPSGIYNIDFTAGSISDQRTVYCDMTTDGGGWTLVAFSNGTATATLANSFFEAGYNAGAVYAKDLANYSASLDPEAFSLAVGSTDAMFISPSYNGGAAYIENGFGLWNYDETKCTGVLRHTSRTAGCSGQNANDNWDGADAFNIAVESGNEGIVPAYKATEVCYNGKGSCSFKFFLR